MSSGSLYGTISWLCWNALNQGPVTSPSQTTFWVRRCLDGLWTLGGPDFVVRRATSGTPKIGELRENHVGGAFPLAVFETLRRVEWLRPIVGRR